MADSNVVKRRVRSASKQAVYYRNYRRARDRALVRLAQANPAQYAVFLAEERERDKSEGKEWKTIAGDTDSVSDHPTDYPSTFDGTATSGDGDSSNPSQAHPGAE